MGQQKGSLVTLKQGDGAEPEVFSVVGGLTNLRLRVENTLLDSSTIMAGAWRGLQAQAGLRMIAIRGSGLFTNGTQEEALRAAALQNSEHNYQLAFPNGGVLEGAFLIAEYMREGSIGEEEAFDLVLESSGQLLYTA